MISLKRHISVFTIGHSTRTLQEFEKILQQYGIELLVDVRTIPRSHTNPQFNSATLSHALSTIGIEYIHMPGLGGLRHTKKDSINTAWHNKSFRGYADYMQTREFQENLLNLIQLAINKRVAIMCAEILPWRCHRSLIGDALIAHGIQVFDIFSSTTCKPHKLTSFAHIYRKKVTYPKI